MLISLKLEYEDDLRKNFKAFVRELASDAKLIDRIHFARNYRPSAAETDNIVSRANHAGLSQQTTKGAGPHCRRKERGVTRVSHDA